MRARPLSRSVAPRLQRTVDTLAEHQTATAAACFSLLVLVYLWPALVGGGVLTPAALLYAFAPWAAAAPPDLHQYDNLLLSDVPMSYLPWDGLARELLHAGTFPAWNPHAFAGTPLWANASVAWLSPFSLPLWILTLNYGLGVAAAAKLWLAGFGTYLLARELRLGFWAGMLAGVAFALCSFNVVWLSHGAHVSAAAMLPWLLWLTERIVRRGRPADGPLLGAVVAVTQLSGHPGTQLHVLAFTFLYAAVRLIAEREFARRDRLVRIATVGAALGAGTLAAAVVLLPAQLAASGTAGEVARRGGASGMPGSTLSADALRAILLPDWWGRPSEGVIAGPGNYNERALYAGAIAAILGMAALISPDGWRRKAPFVALGAVGLAVAFDVAPVRDAVNALPLFDHVQNQRLLLWFLLGVAILAAFGLDRLLKGKHRVQAWSVLCLSALAVVATIGDADLAGGDLGRALRRMTDRFAADTTGSLALASVLRWGLLAAALTAIWLAFQRRRRPMLVGAAIVALAAVDMVTFASGYQPIGPEEKVIPPRTPAIAYLQRYADESRIVGTEYTLASDWSTHYGLRDVRGYDAPQPSLRFFRLWSVLNTAQEGWAPFDLAGISPESTRVLGMLGAGHVVTRPGTALHEERGSLLRKVYDGNDATVYRNELVAPRALVARRVVLAADEDEEFAAVLDPAFDPRTTIVVGADDVGGDRSATELASSGTARVVDEGNAHVTLQTETDSRALVLIDDAWAPGWKVTIDGVAARAVRADFVLRAVVVPPGRHEVRWSYVVPGLRTGLLVSAAGVAVLLAWGAVAWRRRQR
ncbi:hypothetical protein BDZ31_002806 [Conexibacter arvalis]|uniref:YfhO family protein n=1 Tax=Conexibacter arvalis TaxID=912552 RepID=A0A840IE09_9ACTN|nr:hypothetical protein [Conexibacter arvalis]